MIQSCLPKVEFTDLTDRKFLLAVSAGSGPAGAVLLTTTVSVLVALGLQMA